jgi:hypothetical protein
MKICLILAKRVIYDVFSIRTETVGLRGFLYSIVNGYSNRSLNGAYSSRVQVQNIPASQKQNKPEKILLICRRSAESLCRNLIRETPDRVFYLRNADY